MQMKTIMIGQKALQTAILTMTLALAPLAQATLYVYRGPSGEKVVTNIPQTGNGYKLLGQEETVDKISPWVGRKGPTAADAPLLTAIGSKGPYKRKWVNSSEYDAYIRNTAV